MTLRRRDFLAAAASAAPAAEPNIRIATSGFIWQMNIEEGIRTTARFGFHGIEPFRNHIMKYLGQPKELKKQLDDAGIALVTCSNGGDMSVDFLDPAKARQTIEDHERFAGDFIAHFGCKHFKINLGRRPAEAPTRDQLRNLCDTVNEIGRRTAKLGLKLAPHPHIWSPVERREEVDALLRFTDPDLVGLVMDTAHLTLGGIDPLALMIEQYGRLVAIHFKDTEGKYRGWRGPTPTQQEHRKVNLYKNLGTGGVAFPEIVKSIRHRYRGWITLDLDPPRPGEGTIEENLEINRAYVRDVLKLLPA